MDRATDAGADNVIRDLRRVAGAELTTLLALNNAHATELSHLRADEFTRMVETEFCALVIGTRALLVAFDETADYASPNFRWFRARFSRFVYVDRVVVAPNARGAGLARRLYAETFGRTAATGRTRVVCEVNRDPPHSASDAFHERLGFEPIEQAFLLGTNKEVRYLKRDLTL